MVAKTMRVGIVGCGNILKQYVQGILMWDILELAACADLYLEKAEEAAKEYDIPRAMTVEAMMADPDIDIIVNLTIPAAHAEVSLQAIAAGKHVQSEKPLAITRDDGLAILNAAKEKGVYVGCAPDTILGGGLQTARKLIDEGVIGQPVAAVAFLAGHGPEHWHPNPDFFYQEGAGPLFDMGPYYITALVHLLGPIVGVAGKSVAPFDEREITNPDSRTGEKIPVEVATHTTALLDFAYGATATVMFSWDVWAHNLPRIEIYGSLGTMIIPDPNHFTGPVQVKIGRAEEWVDMPTATSESVMRGIGAADLAYAARDGRKVRASGELAYHVLDVMHAFADSSNAGMRVSIESGNDVQPRPLPSDLPARELDGRLHDHDHDH